MEGAPAVSLFTDLRVTILNKEKLKAIASCKVAGAICLTGLRVVEGNRGLFVSPPARKDDRGEYLDIYFPANREIGDQLRHMVLEKYNELIAASTATGG